MSKNKESWVDTDIDWKIMLIILFGVITLFFLAVAVSAKKENNDLKDQLKILRNVEPFKPPEIADLFEQELKNDPAKTQEFVQKIVDMAVKKHQGMAIQVESFASEELKKQMQEHLKRTDVQSLLRLEQEIDSLKKRISQLIEKADKVEFLQSQLYHALVRVKEFEIVLAKNSELENENWRLRKQMSSITTEGVPVVVWNQWSATACFFEITNLKTKRKCSFFLQSRSHRVVNLVPGDYVINYYESTNKEIYGTENITATPYLSADFSVYVQGEFKENIKCHALIINPP
jgi:hypothetical protein